MHKFGTLMESWTAQRDLGDEVEQAFYKKYGHILDRGFDETGNEKSSFKHLRPDTKAYLAALQNGDKIPESYGAGFTGPIGIGRAVELFKQLIKHNYENDKFPMVAVEYYLRNGNPGSNLYKAIRERFKLPIKNKYELHNVDRKYAKAKLSAHK